MNTEIADRDDHKAEAGLEKFDNITRAAGKRAQELFESKQKGNEVSF